MKTVTEIKELYEKDYYSWTQEMARALSEHRTDDIDFENLAEEVGDLGRREKKELKSQFERLIAHLLKWAYTDKKGHETSWSASIKESRNQIRDSLKENPGLKPFVREIYTGSYEHGVLWAMTDTNQDVFPEESPWTLEQVTDSEFFPENVPPATGKKTFDSGHR